MTRWLIVLALAAGSSSPSEPLALLDEPSRGTAVVHVGAPTGAVLLPDDGRSGSVAWTAPNGSSATLRVPRGGTCLVLDVGAHRFDVAPRVGGGSLLLSSDDGAGVVLEVPRVLAPSLSAYVCVASFLVCLATCTRNVKRRESKRRPARPEGAFRDR